MGEAGIDVGIFKSHSVHGATCSKAAGAGVTTKQILEVADWSSEGTFQQFYHRKVEKEWMTELVLVQGCCHPTMLQTIHVDMKRSLPKCNLRMAQGTKWLHAIRNYMRKVKLKYQHVPPSTP